MNGSETHVFLYRCKHGKVRAVAVDDSMTAQHCLPHMKTFQGYAKKYGGTFEHLTIEEFRKQEWRCPDCDAERAARKKRESA